MSDANGTIVLIHGLLDDSEELGRLEGALRGGRILRGRPRMAGRE